MAKIRGGGKITDSHTTVTEASALVVEVLVKRTEVTKISLGTIRQAGSGGERRLKCLPITGGIKIVVRGNGAVQDLFVYTNNSAATQEIAEGLFE